MGPTLNIHVFSIALRLEDLRFGAAYAKTLQGLPHGIQVERDKLNKYGCPLNLSSHGSQIHFLQVSRVAKTPMANCL